MNRRLVLLVCVVVIIIIISLHGDWTQSILGFNQQTLDPTLQFEEVMNSVYHINISETQQVSKDLKLFRLAMSGSEIKVLLGILEVFTHTIILLM